MWWGFAWASRRPRKGQDIQLSLTITFEVSYHGVTKPISYAKHEFNNQGQATRVTKKLDVKAPAGIQESQYIKYTWMGDGWRNGGPDGDLFVQISIQSNSLWSRKWDDIYTSIEVAVHDLVLGAEYEVAHPDGNVMVKIPKYTQPNDILRVKGKWFGRPWVFAQGGDLMVKLVIRTPKKLSKEETKLREQIKQEAK